MYVVHAACYSAELDGLHEEVAVVRVVQGQHEPHVDEAHLVVVIFIIFELVVMSIIIRRRRIIIVDEAYFGCHYLSSATCLIRPRLFSTTLLVELLSNIAN